MSITNTTRKASVVPNGNAGPHSFSFKVASAANLKAYRVDPTTLAILDTLTQGGGASQYSVSLNSVTEGGSVTLGATLLATFSSTDILLMARETSDDQQTQVPVSNPFPEKSVENALDKLTMRDIEIKEDLSRAVKVPLGAGAFTGTLPTLVASRALKVNGAGNGFVLSAQDPDEVATLAAGDAAAAASSASAAATSASNAASSATAAAGSASSSSTSATNAANSATSAASSATSASASATAANVAKIVWRGPWNGATAYVANDAVYEAGTSYICKLGHTNQVPPNATYWDVLALKGTNGTGTGDLLASNNLSDLASAPTARTNLGLAIGTNVQAYNANLASLAGLTLAQGDILYATGANTLVKLAKGTAGQRLTMNAGATAPEWQTPATVTSDVVKLATLTASSSTQLAMTGVDLSAYRHLKIIGTNIVPATDNVTLGFQGSSDNGATYSGTLGHYQNNALGVTAAPVNDTKGIIMDAVGNAGGEFVSFEMTLHEFATSAGRVARVLSFGKNQAGSYVSGGNNFVAFSGGISYNAIRFFFSSGNIASGKIEVYGVK